MTGRTRRGLLRWMGAAGASGLAGCQQLDRTDAAPDSTPDKDAVEIQREVDVGVSISEGEAGQHLTVTGTIVSPDGIDAVVVSTDGEVVRIELDGGDRHALAARLIADGGRAYEVHVEVLEPGGTSFGDTIQTGYVPVFVDDVPEPERLVGAHYYPWYEMQPGHQDWTDRTIEQPVLGEYAADDHTVIDQHLAWCLEHGIRWLSMSWWGPGSGPDRALKDGILEVDRFDDIQFSVLYETLGRLGEWGFDMDEPAARRRLADDLRYLDDTYFGRENYLHFDGRPVVFVYIANRLRGDLRAALDDIGARLGWTPYLLADVPFDNAPGTFAITHVADAVTAYNPYAAKPNIESVFHDRFEHGNKGLQLGANAAGIGFVPVTLPGYNDTAIPDSQRVDNPVLSASPERFGRVCDQVAPHLPDAEAMLVTSFNEWYENTQTEPSEAHGTEYLRLVRDRLTTGSAPPYDPDGLAVRLAFNRTVVPAEVDPDSPDRRPLSFMATEISLLEDGADLVSADVGAPATEPVYLEGVYGAETDGSVQWRWFGGHTAAAVLFFEGDVDAADGLILTGTPIRPNEIEATVSVAGETVDHVQFGERRGLEPYEISLG